jgi:UDPglucose--hexose-1-phosphate uridylyltransferase
MPEFRKDPMVERWANVATERRQRPIDALLQPATQPLDDCPCCASREAMTTPAVRAYRAGPTAPTRPSGRSARRCSARILARRRARHGSVSRRD